jgi:hypothetical protein
MKRTGAFLTLFLSLSTLLCCALPALLVALGFGAAFSSFLSQFEQLIWISENKNIVFLLAGISLALAGYSQWRAQSEVCPVDPQLREACLWSRRWGLRIYLASLLFFLVGFFFAFLITWLPI